MLEYKDDRLFLLSIEEFETYKNKIPKINTWWWLRSPGGSSRHAAYVHRDGTVYQGGSPVYEDSIGVRPALWFYSTTLKVGDRFIYCGVTWVVLDNNLAIAEMPITFNYFNPMRNNYEESEVRKLLRRWYMERKNFKEVLTEAE